jgi:hypothetical protein
MTRTFLHSFDPSSASPITGATADLDVADIEDAGIREVLQTPMRFLLRPALGATPTD